MSEEQTPADTQPVEAPATQEATSTESKSWFTDSGEWNREAFGEGLGEHSIFDKYKTPEELVKATINKDGLIGKKAEEFWTSEDPDIVSKRSEIMGVPKDASGYEFNIEFPEGIEISQERIEASKEIFKELGIPKAAAEKLIEWDVNNAAEAYKAQQEQYEVQMQEATGQLQKEWKDKYDYNVSKVGDILDHLGLSEMKDDPATGNNPAFIKAVFEKIVPLVENDTIIEARQSQSLASIEDSLNDVEDKIFAWPQDQLGTGEYNRLVSKRAELLQKLG